MPVSYIDIPGGVSHSAKEKMSREVFDAIHDLLLAIRRGLGPVVHVCAQLDRPSSVRNSSRADSVG
jgi:hypothetical protein